VPGETITSLHNPRVKALLRLRERRGRDEAGVMLIEGGDELGLALAGGVAPQTVFVCRELTRDPDAAARLELQLRAVAEIVEVSPTVFAKIAYRENPDGWLAVAPAPGRTLTDLALPPNPLLLVCEGVEKPGNLGAMLRTADAAGAHALIVCDPGTDLGNPNVVRASRGTLFTVPVAVAEGAEALAWLKARGIRVAAATPGAQLTYTDADLRGPLALAVGAEDAGLSALWLDGADVQVRIPMTGKVNSLNVAASAALLLYEAVRQRGLRPPLC
jgi:TrmH family RNA methyltransferase